MPRLTEDTHLKGLCTLIQNMLLVAFFLAGTLTPVTPQPPALTITAPRRMESLSGSCVQIPCIFTPRTGFDSTRETYGVWIENGPYFNGVHSGKVIFNSSGTVTTYPMQIIGDLTLKNCTTLFDNLTTSYTNNYHFRIENAPFKAIATRGLYLTVKDEPPAPQITITGKLKEGNRVNVTCSAVAPCPQHPPDLQWNLPVKAKSQLEENDDRTITARSKGTLTASDSLHGVNITCSAVYPVENKRTKMAERTVTLNVSYSPKDTSASISPAGPVSVGSWVNLTCSSRANPPVSHFSWFRNSKDRPKNVSGGGVFGFNVTDDDEGVYLCVATNDIGNQSSSVRLTLKRPEHWTSSLLIAAVVGGIVGLIFLISLVVSVWCLRTRYSARQQTQHRLDEEPANQAGEDIHYGEIDFSKVQAKPVSSDSKPVEAERQDSEYAEVNVSQPTNDPQKTQPADVPEGLYAVVKKH